MHDLAPELHGEVFTFAQARAAGVSRQMLRGRRIRRLFPDVYTTASTTVTLDLQVRAALLTLPDDAAASHTTALHLRGVSVGQPWPLHFSTNTSGQTRITNLVLHRRLGRLHPVDIDGIPVLGADRTFVDSATILRLRDLVVAGDWLIHLGQTTLDQMIEYAFARHLDGVRRARRASMLVREGVESPRETVVRLLLKFARLPEPLVNRIIVDDNGEFLARGDLVYESYKVLVEYDGWHHERDARQRQRDRERREQLEAAGWRVIVVTSQDLEAPNVIPLRVHAALASRGYRGPRPHMNAVWRRWAA
jgi:hypothetical protein